MRTRFILAAVQLRAAGGPDAGLEKAREAVRAAARQGAEVICLPELCGAAYFCQEEDPRHFDLARPLDDPELAAFGLLSAELGAVVVLPFFEKRAPGLYHNSALVFDADGRRAGLYRKMHIPDDPGYYEKYYFAPGDLGFRAVDTACGRIGVLICWDQWYPEAARIAALNGAAALLYPTAIGWHPVEKEAEGARQREAWMTVQRGHAVANGLYLAAVNRVGLERPAADRPGIEFWGSSFIAGPQGEILAQAPVDREAILTAEVDLARLEQVRRNWPFLRDRRIDAYGDLLKRFVDP